MNTFVVWVTNAGLGWGKSSEFLYVCIELVIIWYTVVTNHYVSSRRLVVRTLIHIIFPPTCCYCSCPLIIMDSLFPHRGTCLLSRVLLGNIGLTVRAAPKVLQLPYMRITIVRRPNDCTWGFLRLSPNITAFGGTREEDIVSPSVVSVHSESIQIELEIRGYIHTSDITGRDMNTYF